jgi:dihydroorotase-like cyclic amidohydrolase
MQLTCTLPEPSSSRALSSARDDDECTILASQLFDPYTKQLVKDQHIRVSKASGLILDVRTFTDEDLAILDLTNPDVLDLRGLTVLPGLVDVHVHRTSHS